MSKRNLTGSDSSGRGFSSQQSGRENVGKTTTEKVEFLRRKTRFWDVNQLIHELTGTYSRLI